MARRKQQPQPLDQQPPQSYPLTEEHAIILDGVQQSCAHCGEVLAKLARAGYDTSSYEDVNNQQNGLATGIKREFFPDRT